MGALSGINPGLAETAAEKLARQSIGWGSLARGIDVAANVAAGVEGYQQANYQAKIAREGAGQTRLAGQAAESALKGKYTRLAAEQKVAAAANGLEVGTGSAQRVADATADVGALDAATLHYNAMREAFGQDVEAALLERTGASAAIRGAAGAATSFLSGTRSLSEKWSAYKQNIGGPTYG